MRVEAAMGSASFLGQQVVAPRALAGTRVAGRMGRSGVVKVKAMFERWGWGWFVGGLDRAAAVDCAVG
jgi:hypothetical protein